MKYLLVVALLFLSTQALSEENQCKQFKTEMPNTTSEQLAQSGCCSHHGGVCGCSGGSDLCCDGAASPSCGCHANDINQYLKSNEAEQPKS